MARKKEVVVVPSSWGERDAGKTFLITEASAAAADKWKWRLVLAAKGTAGVIPEETMQMGWVALAVRGLNAFLASPISFPEIEPLLDDLLTCVRIVRDPRHPDVATAFGEDDIEEIRTIDWLRSEVIRVHTNFSIVDGLLTWLSTMAATPDSPNT